MEEGESRADISEGYALVEDDVLLECSVSMLNMVTGGGGYQDGVTVNDKEEGCGVSVACFLRCKREPFSSHTFYHHLIHIFFLIILRTW